MPQYETSDERHIVMWRKYGSTVPGGIWLNSVITYWWVGFFRTFLIATVVERLLPHSKIPLHCVLLPAHPLRQVLNFIQQCLLFLLS